jgi:hypothetical protein
MSSENHLTVRDYFDRAAGGRPRTKKGNSPGKTETRGFHQLLTSQQNQRSAKSRGRTGGLKISDYLARPVLTKHNLTLRPAVPPIKKDTANIPGVPLPPVLSGTGKIAQKDPIRAGARIETTAKRHPQIPGLTAENTVLRDRQKIETSILNSARKYDLPVNLIASVIRAESNFDARAVSPAGAQGLMQLMPATARDLGVKNPFNIAENIDGGSRYLRQMLDSFDGDLKLALAAYNAGPEAVTKYGGKVPPYLETQQYVKRVLRFTRQMA